MRVALASLLLLAPACDQFFNLAAIGALDDGGPGTTGDGAIDGAIVTDDDAPMTSDGPRLIDAGPQIMIDAQIDALSLADAPLCPNTLSCTGGFATYFTCGNTCYATCGAMVTIGSSDPCAPWGKLVTIDNATEDACIGQSAISGPYWIGLYQLALQPTPATGWVTAGGTVQTYFNWDTDGFQPDDAGGGGMENGVEQCAVFTSTGWHDRSCSASAYKYLCER